MTTKPTTTPTKPKPRKCQQADHRYEPGPYDVCRRCGGEKPKLAAAQAVRA